MATQSKTINSSTYIWPSDSHLSLICDGRLTDQIVDDFGEYVKIRQISKSGYNIYGDATEIATDTYSKAYIHQWRITDDEVKEGIYKNGQIMFVFKASDKDKIKTANQIFYHSEWYTITEVEPQIFSGTTYLINAVVKKTVTKNY